MEELVTMSSKELDRMLVLDRVLARTLSQRTAAEMLAVSDRQVRRLLRAYATSGAVALASKRRGKPSNRKLPDDLRASAVERVRERYADFGPTLAAEKLREVHGLFGVCGDLTQVDARSGTLDFEDGAAAPSTAAATPARVLR